MLKIQTTNMAYVSYIDSNILVTFEVTYLSNPFELGFFSRTVQRLTWRRAQSLR